MKLTLFSLNVLATAVAQSPYNISVADFPQGSLDATAWSLIYTYPVFIFANWAGNVLRNYSVNSIFHQRCLASPDDPGVIKPNIDTVYSRAVLDLSEHDVELTVPNITNRYYVFPVYDFFGGVVAEIGAVNNNTAGKYLIRRAQDADAVAGYQSTQQAQLWLGSPSMNIPRYQGVINVPTTYATMLIRILIKQNTTEELDEVRGYQNASSLVGVARSFVSGSNPSEYAPPLTSLAPNGTFLGVDSLDKQLKLAAKLVPYNQPANYTERDRVSSALALAGIYNGAYNSPQGLSLTLAGVIANSSITQATVEAENLRRESNNRVLQRPEGQGDYGLNYAIRAYIAIAGYQQQRTVQVLYPGYRVLGFTGTFSLKPSTSILLSFSGKPKVDSQYGFWSYSVYGSDQYLIANDLFRFEIGDRSLNLTYQNSKDKIYGPGSNTTQDGPFQVLVQPAEQVPPSNWTGNWLPAAADFAFVLRWYVPDAAMTDGAYMYPKVETIDAIVA
ncbi:hypothetical protein DOTSEDRAFT_119116 [Dothistroma septosporum NZE10]|uniref:DUF1254 domain-containing protein n=1 Tax=Dothistroma septosporum (strain NZE10 / CBS 128990) TaxID=675120 RepID=N1Q473_DOTSN|nr:hypothetical protein DOTSEDRAFT_119116 [Dothistroma septosporum NZE10]